MKFHFKQMNYENNFLLKVILWVLNNIFEDETSMIVGNDGRKAIILIDGTNGEVCLFFY
jgi:hypothetical protein